MAETTPAEAARGLEPFAHGLAVVIGVLLTLGPIGWAFDLHLSVGVDLYPAQYFAGMLTLALPLAFIVLPFRRGSGKTTVPWYDWVLAALGFAAVGYLTWQYQQLVDLILLRPTDAVVGGLIGLILSIEALRRATGNALPLIVIVFVTYALLGHLFPGRLAAQPTDWEKLTAYLALDVNGVLGIALSVAVTLIIPFLLFSQFLNASGGSEFLTDLAMVTMGRFRGGPAKIAVVGSSLFGSVNGYAVANVMATGIITIPMIKRSGYEPHKAGAIEAVASTGGQLMPPIMGASAFLMAEFLNIGYADVMLAAALPAVIYYIALFIQADLEAAKIGAAGLKRAEIPKFSRTFSGWHFILPFVVLIVALFTFRQPPQIAAMAASVVLVAFAAVFGYRGARPDWRAMAAAFYKAGHAALDIIMICVAAGIVIGVLGISGLGSNLTLTLVELGRGSVILLLLLSAGVCILLGMGLPTIAVYVLLAALVAPSLVEVGIEPIAAHLFVMYFGMMSMITPPVAIAAFAAAGIARSEPMKTGWSAVRFGWMAYVVPFLFVSSPALLLIGATMQIVLAMATAVVGVWLVSIALSGYLFRRVSIVMRVAFAVSGLLALIPAGAFEGAQITDVAGMLAGLALTGYEVMVRRRAAVSAAE